MFSKQIYVGCVLPVPLCNLPPKMHSQMHRHKTPCTMTRCQGKKEKPLLFVASHINGYFILKSRHMLSNLKSCSRGEKKKSSSSTINAFITILLAAQPCTISGGSLFPYTIPQNRKEGIHVRCSTSAGTGSSHSCNSCNKIVMNGPQTPGATF